MEGWKFWWGIAAFFLGGLATQLNGWLTYRRQRADKREEAADVLRKRREEFELQHLVEVNQLVRVALDRLLEYYTAERRYRAAHQIDPHDVEPRQRSEEASAAFTAALSDLTAQTPFLLNDRIRQAASDLVAYLARASAVMAATGQLDVVEFSAVADRLHEPLGARVREIYAGQEGA
ncbi:hypothetical protein ADK77_44135 [Streptomyces antibioticus]|nr:hypothetical protein [Streptomyces antibioticus]KOG58425.1 hypothetical protein ADK77_44135 [Streptomyces antibioticus]